jgi:hypothetical protein
MATLSSDDLRAAIEQHICVIAGVPYQFRLEWCAIEKYVEPISARHLLNIECIASADSSNECVPLHVVVWLTDLGDLRGILRDALHTHLVNRHANETDCDAAHSEIPLAIASTSRVQ